MGQSCRFRCDACGYEAVVTGGDDVGMRCYTTTVICLDCQALHDVATADTPFDPTQTPATYPLACPENSQHRCHKWSKRHACPKCKTPMQRGELEVMWE